MAVAAMVFVACQESKVCKIHGTVVGEQYEGKRIFLVPFSGPATAETVDSIEIKDGKFEFTPDSMQIYKILLDYHYRFGTQPLIVVAEPGDIQVTIDTVSSAVGTPQNDSLAGMERADGEVAEGTCSTDTARLCQEATERLCRCCPGGRAGEKDVCRL